MLTAYGKRVTPVLDTGLAADNTNQKGRFALDREVALRGFTIFNALNGNHGA